MHCCAPVMVCQPAGHRHVLGPPQCLQSERGLSIAGTYMQADSIYTHPRFEGTSFEQTIEVEQAARSHLVPPHPKGCPRVFA